jgi:hypothetical protein
MLRIMIPAIKLWYFLLPGFSLAILLSFFAEPIFVGIAYDAGGVASGPMSATFVLAFAQGAADIIPTANVLIDGFGVIAMIAMTPVLSLMILGTLIAYRKKRATFPILSEEDTDEAIPLIKSDGYHKDLIFLVLQRGKSDETILLARELGARGATILHGRDARAHALSGFSLNMDPEKEILLLIVPSTITQSVTQSLLEEQFSNPKSGIDSLMVLPASSHRGFTPRV